MEYSLAALSFGLIAGLKPGPLGIYVIDQTMRKGAFSGFWASLAPLITDGPIIVLVLLLTLSVKEQAAVVSIISFFGAVYLANMSIKILRNRKEIDFRGKGAAASGLATAVKINLLNPSPYLFWFTIGGSYIVSGTKIEAVVFIVVALVSLCLTKYVVALLVSMLGARFKPKVYGAFLKALALPLLYFSFSLVCEGIDQFNRASVL